MKMPRWLWLACNGLDAVALVLLILDPGRNLWPVVGLLVVAVVLLYGWRYWPWRRG